MLIGDKVFSFTRQGKKQIHNQMRNLAPYMVQSLRANELQMKIAEYLASTRAVQIHDEFVLSSDVDFAEIEQRILGFLTPEELECINFHTMYGGPLEEPLCQCVYCGTALPYPTMCPGCGMDCSPAAIYREALDETMNFVMEVGGNFDMYILLAEEADRVNVPERYTSFLRKELIERIQEWKLSGQSCC